MADGMAAASTSVGTVDFVLSVGDNFYLRGVLDEFDLNWRYMSLGWKKIAGISAGMGDAAWVPPAGFQG